jgi:hypothetical protein
MNKKILLAVVAGFLVGVFWLTALRFVLIKDPTVHYHANFALYINGQRDEFKSFTFYEEVASCNAADTDNPKNLVHMHDSKNHIVHVHGKGMTWGAFFNNLGYTLGDDLIKTDNGIFTDETNGNQLTFIINGQTAGSVTNSVIKSEDTLLINYGRDDDATLQERYKAIPHDAGEANKTADPAACGGGQKWDFPTRLKAALGLS